MKNILNNVIIASAMMVASPAMAAVPVTSATVDLSGTNAAASTATVNLAAGSYTVSLVKGVYTALSVATPASPNFVDYYRYTIGGVETTWNPFASLPRSGQRFETADAAFAAYSAQPQLSLSFATDTTVTFAVGDNVDSFWDNTGGTSLSIAAVPEPATWLTMILGFVGVSLAMRRKRRTGVATVVA